jgi:hypothetical protein
VLLAEEAEGRIVRVDDLETLAFRLQQQHPGQRLGEVASEQLLARRDLVEEVAALLDRHGEGERHQGGAQQPQLDHGACPGDRAGPDRDVGGERTVSFGGQDGPKHARAEELPGQGPHAQPERGPDQEGEWREGDGQWLVRREDEQGHGEQGGGLDGQLDQTPVVRLPAQGQRHRNDHERGCRVGRPDVAPGLVEHSSVERGDRQRGTRGDHDCPGHRGAHQAEEVVERREPWTGGDAALQHQGGHDRLGCVGQTKADGDVECAASGEVRGATRDDDAGRQGRPPGPRRERQEAHRDAGGWPPGGDLSPFGGEVDGLRSREVDGDQRPERSECARVRGTARAGHVVHCRSIRGRM